MMVQVNGNHYIPASLKLYGICSKTGKQANLLAYLFTLTEVMKLILKTRPDIFTKNDERIQSLLSLGAIIFSLHFDSNHTQFANQVSVKSPIGCSLNINASQALS